MGKTTFPVAIAQLVASLVADPWVVGIDHGPAAYFHGDQAGNILDGHSLPLADLRRIGVCEFQVKVHKVLVNRLVKLAQEKVWFNLNCNILVVCWDVKQ